jgi:hypothetical protein
MILMDLIMRQILPLEFANKRAKYVRNRLYAIAAKVLQHVLMLVPLGNAS